MLFAARKRHCLTIFVDLARDGPGVGSNPALNEFGSDLIDVSDDLRGDDKGVLRARFQKLSLNSNDAQNRSLMWQNAVILIRKGVTLTT